tara:strand:+ start:599 stop:742 length:144 start_codon:yes stop_codon:yes gene_type:complete
VYTIRYTKISDRVQELYLKINLIRGDFGTVAVSATLGYSIPLRISSC